MKQKGKRFILVNIIILTKVSIFITIIEVTIFIISFLFLQIDMPDDQKLPQSQWAKKIMTSLPRPLVMKHDHRELNYAKKKLMPQQEDSFADLSYHQAEVSVCTQKSAFKSNKNF